MHASDIVFALKEAAEGPHALQNVRRVLNGWRERIDEIAAALDFIPGTDGNANQAFYRTPELSVLKVLFPSGRPDAAARPRLLGGDPGAFGLGKEHHLPPRR